MTDRRSISTRERKRLFTLHAAICHVCHGKIMVGEAWEVSHEIPLELGGADDDANRMLAHQKCHRWITASQDIPAIAKAKRREAKHLGIKSKSSRSLSDPRWRKRMDGQVVPR